MQCSLNSAVYTFCKKNNIPLYVCKESYSLKTMINMFSKRKKCYHQKFTWSNYAQVLLHGQFKGTDLESLISNFSAHGVQQHFYSGLKATALNTQTIAATTAKLLENCWTFPKYPDSAVCCLWVKGTCLLETLGYGTGIGSKKWRPQSLDSNEGSQWRTWIQKQVSRGKQGAEQEELARQCAGPRTAPNLPQELPEN